MTRLKLTLRQFITHYSLVLLLMIPNLLSVFSILENALGVYRGNAGVEGWYSSVIFFSIVILLLFIIQYRRLNFTKIEIDFTEKQFKEAIRRTAKELEWEIFKNNKKMLQATRNDMFGTLLGELITIIKGEGFILINSICDPNKWTNIFSYNRNKENVKIFLKNLSDVTNEIPEIQKTEVIDNEWSPMRLLIRVILYPVSIFFIFLGVVMIYQHISLRNLIAGVLLILLCVVVLYADIKLWSNYKKKNEQKSK